jgi:hypothetical protein
MMTKRPNVRMRRIYDEPTRKDGTRVLVDRVWPRGLSKDAAHIDEWFKQVAPSTKLPSARLTPRRPLCILQGRSSEIHALLVGCYRFKPRIDSCWTQRRCLSPFVRFLLVGTSAWVLLTLGQHGCGRDAPVRQAGAKYLCVCYESALSISLGVFQ